MNNQINQIKSSFLKYLIALDYKSVKEDILRVDDLDFVIACDLGIRNTPMHDDLLRWGDNIMEKVNRGLM